MRMFDFPIGTVFTYRTKNKIVALKVIETKNPYLGCTNCWAKKTDAAWRLDLCRMSTCGSVQRADGKRAFYVEVKEK